MAEELVGGWRRRGSSCDSDILNDASGGRSASPTCSSMLNNPTVVGSSFGDNTLMQLMQRAQEAHRQTDREVSGEWASGPEHARLGRWMGAGWVRRRAIHT